MMELSIERLVPHRDRMRLIDAIIAVDQNEAITQSVVKKDWPLTVGGRVNTLVLIELVAQSASVHIGWRELQENHDQACGRGWLVGIKSARFDMTAIPVESCIVTVVKPEYHFENYTGIYGLAHIDQQSVGEVRLQVMRSESDSVLIRSSI